MWIFLVAFTKNLEVKCLTNGNVTISANATLALVSSWAEYNVVSLQLQATLLLYLVQRRHKTRGHVFISQSLVGITKKTKNCLYTRGELHIITVCEIINRELIYFKSNLWIIVLRSFAFILKCPFLWQHNPFHLSLYSTSAGSKCYCYCSQHVFKINEWQWKLVALQITSRTPSQVSSI